MKRYTHFIIVLAALSVAGCSTIPQSTADLVRSEYPEESGQSGVMPEHPYLSQVAVNLPPADKVDVYMVPVPQDWRGDLAGGTFTDEVSTKKVALNRRYAFRAETCGSESLTCKTSAIVENGSMYAFLTPGQNSVTALSAYGKKLRISRENGRKLSNREKADLWNLVRKRSGGNRLVITDDTTGETFTVIPLGSEYMKAAGITGAALRWQKESVCGWRSISTDDVLAVATAPANPTVLVSGLIGRGMSYYCSRTMNPNVLSIGKNPGGER